MKKTKYIIDIAFLALVLFVLIDGSTEGKDNDDYDIITYARADNL